MGTLVAFSRSFGTHHHLLQAKRFKFILRTALFSSPEFSLFGTAPCQAEALQVLLNLTKSPLGMSLWMPFMEPMRLALDYSGNYQPVVALGVSRKPHWMMTSTKVIFCQFNCFIIHLGEFPNLSSGTTFISFCHISVILTPFVTPLGHLDPFVTPL